MAQWVTDSLNPSVYTYEVAPVFTLLEHKLLREMRRYVGFPDGSGDGVFCPGGSMANTYGIQCARHHAMPDLKVSPRTLFQPVSSKLLKFLTLIKSSSTTINISFTYKTAISSKQSCIASFKGRKLILHILLKFQEKGTFASRRLVVLTSKDAHYSIKKACFLLGIGSSNLYLVDVDSDGRMNLAHLREEIQRALREGARPFMVSATAG